MIKKLHKDQAQEIKTYKLKLENLQTLKDVAYKVLVLLYCDNANMRTMNFQGFVFPCFTAHFKKIMSFMYANYK